MKEEFILIYIFYCFMTKYVKCLRIKTLLQDALI